MQVAVIDDNIRFAREVAHTVEEFFSGEGEDAEVQCQDAAELLARLVEGQSIDICLLDVEMPGMDGLALAEKIRERNQEVRIIFLTAYEKYAIPGYRVRAEGYVLKESYQEELPPVLRRICGELRKKTESYYVIQTKTEGYRLRTDDILYLKKDKKYAVFQCTENREYRQRETLENIFRELPQGRFVFIDRGVVVNLRHVVAHAWMTLTMRNEAQLEVSRRMWPLVRQQLHAYWGGK